MFRMACIFVCMAIVSNVRWRGRDAAPLARSREPPAPIRLGPVRPHAS
jgi:hypothetical protein